MKTRGCLLTLLAAPAIGAFIPSYPIRPTTLSASSDRDRQTHSSPFYTTTTFQPRTGSLSGPLWMSDEVVEISLDADERMVKSVESTKINLGSIRAGRANSAMLDRIKVEYYGVDTPLNQMATITVASSQQLTIGPYDKSSLGSIEKAISQSDLGVTPNNDGSVIRINIPPLTEERRKALLKQVKAIGEEGKIAIRNVRRDGVDSIKKLEKNGECSKDEMQDGLDDIQKMTDKRVKEIDSLVAAKEKEVMTV